MFGPILKCWQGYLSNHCIGKEKVIHIFGNVCRDICLISALEKKGFFNLLSNALICLILALKKVRIF